MALKRGRAIFAEMNMIPLIDVSLIILVIFMVITPMLVQTQLKIRLPKASKADSAESQKTLQIVIDRKGRMTLDGRKIKRSALKKELTLQLRKSAEKRVLVQADREVPIQTVVEILDIAKQLGVGELGIGVIRNK